MKWKQIKDFEEYQISNTGLIKRNGIVLNPFNNDGYLRILLSNGLIKKKKLIHRLVAEAFIPNEDNKKQVNHIDLNKLNNNVKNLEWVTPKENVQHAIKNIESRREYLKTKMSDIGKQYGKENALKTRKKIIQLDLNDNIVNEFDSARDASRELNISYKVISKCCNGNSKSYKGFKWKFANK